MLSFIINNIQSQVLYNDFNTTSTTIPANPDPIPLTGNTSGTLSQGEYIVASNPATYEPSLQNYDSWWSTAYGDVRGFPTNEMLITYLNNTETVIWEQNVEDIDIDGVYSFQFFVLNLLKNKVVTVGSTQYLNYDYPEIEIRLVFDDPSNQGTVLFTATVGEDPITVDYKNVSADYVFATSTPTVWQFCEKTLDIGSIISLEGYENNYSSYSTADVNIQIVGRAPNTSYDSEALYDNRFLGFDNISLWNGQGGTSFCSTKPVLNVANRICKNTQYSYTATCSCCSSPQFYQDDYQVTSALLAVLTQQYMHTFDLVEQASGRSRIILHDERYVENAPVPAFEIDYHNDPVDWENIITTIDFTNTTSQPFFAYYYYTWTKSGGGATESTTPELYPDNLGALPDTWAPTGYDYNFSTYSNDYQVTLQADNGCVEETSQDICMLYNEFDYTRNASGIANNVYFIADEDMEGTEYSWWYNGQEISDQRSLTYQFASGSSPVTVELRVSKDNCIPAKLSKTINLCVALESLSASPTSICLGESIGLAASGCSASEIYWYIDGDRKFSGGNVDWYPSRPGTFQVTVEAILSGGFPITQNVGTVEVYPNPEVDFTYQYDPKTKKVKFSPKVNVSQTVTYEWFTVDGGGTATSFSTLENPEKTFDDYGPQTIRLEIEGSCCTDDHPCYVEKSICIEENFLDCCDCQ